MLLFTGTATALLEAARTASAAAGLRAGEVATPSGKHREPRDPAQEGPGPQGPGGAETRQQWKIRLVYELESKWLDFEFPLTSLLSTHRCLSLLKRGSVEEIEQMNNLFQQKQRELVMAASKVEDLSRQLEILKNGKMDNFHDSQGSVAELDRLYKELQVWDSFFFF